MSANHNLPKSGKKRLLFPPFPLNTAWLKSLFEGKQWNEARKRTRFMELRIRSASLYGSRRGSSIYKWWDESESTLSWRNLQKSTYYLRCHSRRSRWPSKIIEHHRKGSQTLEASSSVSVPSVLSSTFDAKPLLARRSEIKPPRHRTPPKRRLKGILKAF